MRNVTSLARFAVTLFWMTCVSGCASFAIASLQPLEQRVLDISLDRPALEYRHWECVEWHWPRTLDWCKRTEMRTEYYDLTDPAVRQKLVDMGFVAMVEPKP